MILCQFLLLVTVIRSMSQTNISTSLDTATSPEEIPATTVEESEKDDEDSSCDDFPVIDTTSIENETVIDRTSKTLSKSDIQKQCTNNIDEIFSGNIAAAPAFVDSLITFFSKDIPDPKNKKMYAADMGDKVSYLLKYTWEKGNSTAHHHITSSGYQINSVKSLVDDAELFLLGVLVAIGPCKGIWVGKFTMRYTQTWLINFKEKYMQTIFLAIILLSSFSSVMIETMKFCLEYRLGTEKSGNMNRALLKFGGAWCAVSFLNAHPELSLSIVLAVMLT